MEVGLELKPEAPTTFVHEVTPVVEEKDLLVALEGDVAASVEEAPAALEAESILAVEEQEFVALEVAAQEEEAPVVKAEIPNAKATRVMKVKGLVFV